MRKINKVVFVQTHKLVKIIRLLMEKVRGIELPTDLGGGSSRKDITSTGGDDLNEKREGEGGERGERGRSVEGGGRQTEREREVYMKYKLYE